MEMEMEIQHFSHEHKLTFVEDMRQKLEDVKMRWRSRNDTSNSESKLDRGEVQEREDLKLCKCCYQVVDDAEGEGYSCETCEYFWLHKSCALLPLELQHHPFHSPHPLILTARTFLSQLHQFGFSGRRNFICDACRYLCPGFAYHCAQCQFSLDVKCTLITDGTDQHHHHQRSSIQLLDAKSEMYHPSHIHRLISFNSTRFESYDQCSGCTMILQGLVYGCFDCMYFLHKSCVETPQEIQHPYHPQHPLLLRYDERRRVSPFICDICWGISRGFDFQCEHCNIKLDVRCALLMDGSLGHQRFEEECEINTQISHFSHHHTLLLFKEVNYKAHLNCNVCKLNILGVGYACLKCYFYLHKYCAEMIQEIQHSYHPVHPLRALFKKYPVGACVVCKCQTPEEELMYNCSECGFCLHIMCAKVSLGVAPALKHNCHHHSLYYFVGKSTLLKYRGIWAVIRRFICYVCAKNCMGPCYICLKCEDVFHLECIPIPQVVFKRDFHMHSLTLREPLVAADDEDKSKEYYCFACERERNPKYRAYCCDQCSYQAHIECMVSEFVDEEYSNSAWTSNNADEKKGVAEYPTIAEYSVPRCRRQLQIGDFSNNHIMICHETWIWKLCYVCNVMFWGPAYNCEFCNVSFHRVCVELPPKIRHTLHLLHPLILLMRSKFKYYKCDGCATISSDETYYQCEECKFMLDIKCASRKDKHQLLEERDGNVTISHFSHQHELLLANCPEYLFRRCSVCLMYISNPAYCCLDCKFFIHESCTKVERVIHQNPFHPDHPLVWTDPHIAHLCQACESMDSISFVYCCSKCGFHIHYACSRYLSSTLKYKNHEHSLFYFMAKDFSNKYFPCNVCKNNCNESFYRCVECDLNLHLQCIPLPQKVKGASHMHPVTLMDSVVQDCWEEQYCYYCEDVRNPDHAVYSCEDCVYIAHIGCVLDNADDSLQIFSSSIASPQRGNLRIEFGETSGNVDSEEVHLIDPVQESEKEPLEIVEVDKEIELLEQDMKSLKSN